MPHSSRPASHTAQQLAELQQRYDALFALNPDPVYFKDLRGLITAANQACAEISGYALEEIVGRPTSQLIAPEQLNRSRKHFVAALRGVPQNYELTFLTKNGRR